MTVIIITILYKFNYNYSILHCKKTTKKKRTRPAQDLSRHLSQTVQTAQGPHKVCLGKTLVQPCAVQGRPAKATVGPQVRECWDRTRPHTSQPHKARTSLGQPDRPRRTRVFFKV